MEILFNFHSYTYSYLLVSWLFYNLKFYFYFLFSSFYLISFKNFIFILYYFFFFFVTYFYKKYIFPNVIYDFPQFFLYIIYFRGLAKFLFLYTYYILLHFY